MREKQSARLTAFLPRLGWTFGDHPVDAENGYTGCVLSNELIDSFPVHIVHQSGGKLQEVFVTLQGGLLGETLSDSSSPALSEYLDRYGTPLAEGQRAEINLQALVWLEKASRTLERGFILTIDYGFEAEALYAPSRREGTLLAYYRHGAFPDPYRRLGFQDLTAHVNFTALLQRFPGLTTTVCQGDSRGILDKLLKKEVELCPTQDEKISILREMVEIYRERLNLDVMVVNALSQILQLEPGHQGVLEELAAQYEKMNRWTDLISVLKKKAEATTEADERVALWSRVAALFVERFSNQAEAIKPYEQVIELDPRNRDALSSLKSMYEKRRDWDKLIGIYQLEIDLLESDSERAVRYVEVAELASRFPPLATTSTSIWISTCDDL